MKVRAKQIAIGLGALFVIGGGITLASFLGGYKKQPPNVVRIDGSSTVFPITDAIAKEYSQTNNEDLRSSS